jgi:hypothetical protein
MEARVTLSNRLLHNCLRRAFSLHASRIFGTGQRIRVNVFRGSEQHKGLALWFSKSEIESADGRTRTGTGRLSPTDFKSVASAISPHRHLPRYMAAVYARARFSQSQSARSIVVSPKAVDLRCDLCAAFTHLFQNPQRLNGTGFRDRRRIERRVLPELVP